MKYAASASLLTATLRTSLALVHLPHRSAGQPYAGAPVRSKPRRTYDPARPVRDPEGDYVPMYWADVFFRDRETWNDLKERIEAFGKAAGLFDEVAVRSLGAKASEPFRLEVRRFGNRLKGPPRNLIDVGYGVSQVLPVRNRVAAAGCSAGLTPATAGSSSPPEGPGSARHSCCAPLPTGIVS